MGTNVPSFPGEVSSAYLKAVSRFIEFGELAGQAMIWDYLEEPDPVVPAKRGTFELAPAISFVVSQNGQKKQELLIQLGDDPTLVRWLLPILRVRMESFKQAISEGRINETISLSEIAGIESYLYKHGETADLQELESIIRSLADHGFEQKLFKAYRSVSEGASEIAEARRIYKLHARPYYQGFIEFLKIHGVNLVPTERHKDSPVAVVDSAENSPPALRMAESEPVVKSSPPDEGIAPLMRGTGWTLLVAGIAFLLWLMRKKQK